MKLPGARGTVSGAVIDLLAGKATTVPAGRAPDDDEDLQLALFVCYELAYRGWDGVDDAWEWDPGLLTLRAGLEARFEAGLHGVAGWPAAADPQEVPRLLAETAAADDGPSLSGFLRGRATREQFREFVIHRSVHHLREADPHTWAVPRLAGRPKAR